MNRKERRKSKNDPFCLAKTVTNFASDVPTSPDPLIEAGYSEEDATFNIDVFEETMIGFQSIVDRFGCSEQGVEALKGVTMYYTKVLAIAEKHHTFCDDKLQKDSESLDKLL